MSKPVTFTLNIPEKEGVSFALDLFTLSALQMLKAADDIRRAEGVTVRMSPSDRVRLTRAGMVELIGLLSTATSDQRSELLRFFDEVSTPFLVDMITPKVRGGLRSVP